MTKKETPENFDSALSRLEKIVERLESGEIPLEEAIRIHAEGLKLKAHCAGLLREAELKLNNISPDAGRSEDEETLDASEKVNNDSDDEIPSFRKDQGKKDG